VKCRHCFAHVTLRFLDLGTSPPSNAYVPVDRLSAAEKWLPLRVLVCESCWLVQTDDFADGRELFDERYSYFSGFSETWLRHCKAYVAEVSSRFRLGAQSHVIEVAANDGSLLQFVKARGIPCMGVEPTASTAQAARSRGLAVVQEFFGTRLATQFRERGDAADLIVANNVLAHVPDVNDFVNGFTIALKEGGIATFEFPSLRNLVSLCQFDTVYHEHFSYLSLTSAEAIFARNGLSAFDVEVLSTHGGSLRVYVQRSDTGRYEASQRLIQMRSQEVTAGIASSHFYRGFQSKAESCKNSFLRFLLDAKRDGLTVAGYGAAAKGNTLLNFAGVRPDLISFVVDRNPAKIGQHLPGSRIPIVDEGTLSEVKPDYIVILPWNLKDEITAQLHYARSWGTRYVTAIPELNIQ
jgi:SAM-dependent methyltransferase